jgi:5-methylcytosine-specific restriction endonuclease McrA
MINYTDKLGIDDEAVLNEIIRFKHKPEKQALEKCKKYVFEDYHNYEDNSGNLQLLIKDKRISKRSRKALIHTFEINPKSLKETRETIKSKLPPILKAKCPYCMVSAHKTFDHYLDKSDYPEFSLFSKNLIPSCSYCNSKKGTRLSEGGNRLFIHFIYDSLPDYPFLKYKLSVKDNHIVLNNITLEFRAGEKNKVLIENHFRCLNLLEILSNNFDVESTTITDEFRGQGFSFDDVKRILTNRTNSYEKNKGINYWGTCILRAMKDNKAIIRFLSS